jgi:hypothetical protein
MVSEESLGRKWIVGILVVLGILLSVLALVAFWADSKLTTTDQFVALVAPLAADPAIQSAITDQVTDAIVARLATEQGAAVSSDDQQRPRIAAAVQEFVQSDRFRELWANALRRAHGTALALLQGTNDGLVSLTTGGQVVLDLAPVVADVEARLSEQGIDAAGAPSSTEPLEIVLYTSPALATAQDLLVLVDRLAILLPIAAVIVLLVALLIARRRGRALVWIGFGLVLAMAVLVILTFGAPRVGDVASSQVASAVLDAVLASLRTNAAVLAVIGLVAAAAGFLIDRQFRV